MKKKNIKQKKKKKKKKKKTNKDRNEQKKNACELILNYSSINSLSVE